ncbi:MAG: translation initiation factor IF-2 N-terminal domain-containing protein [Marinilabiliales bacterium]|nr:translation initiation factor IF-2 N-terminal domain-containing protein [Marinilabiliales bacterium]
MPRQENPRHRNTAVRNVKTIREEIEIDRQKAEEEKKILKVTEFVTVSEMANMMNVPVINIISTFMQLGMFVSINQRLDAETPCPGCRRIRLQS